MTLIAAFPAISGFAICADSQETGYEIDPDTGESYEVRSTVLKISPIVEGKYQVAICGGGDAELIEAFIEKAKRVLHEQDAAACTMQNPASVRAIRARMEQELAKFYAEDVPLFTDSGNRRFKLFIAAACPIASEYALWVSENHVLRDAKKDEPELNGWNHRLYEDTAKRLSSGAMTMGQATLASIYTVQIAKNTSNYVKDPFAVAMVTGKGIRIVEAEYVRTMEERLSEYETWLNRLFLSCSDTTVSVPDLEDQIAAFKDAALNLHKEHIDQQAATTDVLGLLSGKLEGTLPKGPITFMGDGSLRVEHDREKIKQTVEKWRMVKEQIKKVPRSVTCSKCQNVFDVAGGHELPRTTIAVCPSCGEPNELWRKPSEVGQQKD